MCLPFIGRQAERLLQDFFGPFPAFRTHVLGLREISLCSQARAAVQSRCTVAAAIPITSEVSSKERPAKKRNSTTRLCRGSTSAPRLRKHARGSSTPVGPGQPADNKPHAPALCSAEYVRDAHSSSDGGPDGAVRHRPGAGAPP